MDSEKIFNHISPEWDDIIQKDDFLETYARVPDIEIFPPEELLLNAFRYTTPSKLKVVILGQDPYPSPNYACGLSFSCNCAIPASLKNIYKAIDPEYKWTNGCLKHWAIQGILFLNCSLSTIPFKSNVHSHIWRNYTDKLIERISSNTSNILFLLWGNFAKDKAKLINGHKILTYTHPSPLGDNRLPSEKKFMNCPHFKEILKTYPNFTFKKINIRIYTDGACKGNNTKTNRIGGYGVYITTYEGGCFTHSIYGRLSEKILPTNNRAEIMAMIKAFQWIKNMDFHPDNVDFDIYTDSELLFKTITKFMVNWDMNDPNPSFKNPDMIRILYRFNNYLAKKNYNIKFYHIRGHQKDTTIEAIGNNMADKLANDGCRLDHFNTITI